MALHAAVHWPVWRVLKGRVPCNRAIALIISYAYTYYDDDEQ